MKAKIFKNKEEIEFSGGYGENRTFYVKTKKNEYYQFHLGTDIFIPAFTEIIAPFDGEIISYFYLPSKNIKSGIGTSLVLKVWKKDFHLGLDKWNEFFDPKDEFFYIAMIHLDKDFMQDYAKQQIKKLSIKNMEALIVKTISYQKPQKVKRNEEIAKIGNWEDNGGWKPHLHLEIHKQSKDSLGINELRLSSYDPHANGVNIFNAKASGVYLEAINENKKDLSLEFKKVETLFQIINPKKLFDI